MSKYSNSLLGEICDIKKGETGLASATSGDYPLVTTGAERKTCNTFQFDTEAVCIPLVSSTGHGNKSLNYVHFQKGKFALGTILAAVIPKDPKNVSAAFLHRYLQFFKDRKIVPLMKGAANVSLNMKDIAKIEVPIPSIEKQNSFIDYFNKLQESSSELQNEFSDQSSLLSQLRQAILQEAIEGKLTADWRKKNLFKKGDPDFDASALLEKIKTEKEQMIADGKIKKQKPLPPIKPEEIPFELPEGWVWTRLGEIASVVRGGSPRPAGDKKFYDGKIPFLKVADLTTDNSIYLNKHTYTIKEAGLIKTRFVEAGTLMLTNSGATLGIPKICNFPTTFNDGIAAFLGLLPEINKVYLYYLLKSKSIWFLKEAARGQGQPNLNTDIIGETIFGLPPLAEQHAIVERVDRLLTMVDDLEKQVAERKVQADELMQAVLREAFEG